MIATRKQLTASLEDLYYYGLTPKTSRLLGGGLGITHIQELANRRESELLSVDGFGQDQLMELRKAIEAFFNDKKDVARAKALVQKERKK